MEDLEKKHKLFTDNFEYKSDKYKLANIFLKKKDISYIYFLINFDEIVYIGKSINYDARIVAHGFYYNLIRTIKTTKSLAEKWEKKLIKKYQPIHNKNGIETYRARTHTKYEYYYDESMTRKITNFMVRKINNVKVKLNLRFKKKYNNNIPYLGKDSRHFYYNYEEFIKTYKLKYWCKEYDDRKLITFFSYKPKLRDLKHTNTVGLKMYPVSVNPIDLFDL